MKKSLFLFFGLAFLALPFTAQELSDQLPVNPYVKIGKLDNGVTYYAEQNPKPEDKLELRLVINAGSILEDEDQLGLAHFMEHMNFNGTKNFEKNDLVDYLQSIGVKFGADLNAYTSFDETVYILPIPCDDPEKLEKGFQVVEDWAHNATLLEENIDDERGVVLEEYRLGLGSDKRMLREYLPKMMYGSKYVDRLPIGTKEVLENFDYEAVRRYYNDWYRPDLMAIIAVGDLEVDKIVEKIKTHFSRIEMPENPREREVYDLPNHDETFISVASDKEAAFANVQLLYKDYDEAKPLKTYGDYREMLKKRLFSTMLNNRLNEIRNNPNPPFAFGGTYYGGTYARTKNAYQSYAYTSPDDQLRALKMLLVENKRVQEHGFLASELERANKSLIASIEKQYNDRDKRESERIVGEYVRNFLEEEAMPGLSVEYDLYKNYLPNIKLEEVNALIDGFIHDDNRVIILTGPEKEEAEQIKEEEVREVLAEVEGMMIEPYVDDEVPTTLIEELPAKESITSITKNDKIGTKTLNLDNGVKVTYKITDFKNDEVLFRAYSKGGTSLYTDEELMQTTFANGGLASAGIGGYSLNELQRFMSGKIVRVSPYISSDGENMSGSAAPKDLETLFQMTYLYFTDLNKDEEAYQSYIDKQKGFLGNLMADPSFYFSNEVGEHRNEGNPRFSGFPTPEKYDNADYDLAFAKYNERFANAGDFHFFFVGNVDEGQLKQYAEQYLASLPSNGTEDSILVPDFRYKDEFEKYVINRGEDPKSRVRISWEEEMEFDEKTKFEMDALGEVLSIKLIEELREKESGVYGVGARGGFSKVPYEKAYFSISFPCGPENVDKLIKVALAEVEKIKKDGVQAKDLAKVKETYLLEHKVNMKTNRYWLNLLVEAEKGEGNPEKVLDFEKKVNELTSDELKSIANKYLDDAYFVAVLMPDEK